MIITDQPPNKAEDGSGADYDHHTEQEANQRRVCGR
jgi:hypothetical protein